MAFRKRRPTYNVCIENLPIHVTEKDVSKRFTTFGEIHSIFLNNSVKKGTKVAFVKFLCEPDAVKAVADCNGGKWGDNVIVAKRCSKNTSASRKIDDKYNINPPRHPPNFQMHKFNRFPPMPKFIPNQFGNMFRSVAPQGLYFPYGNSSHKPPATNFNIGTVGVNMQPLSTPEERCILCTYVEDAVTFYGQCAVKSNVLSQITSLLQQVCPSLPRLIKVPDYGKLYAAIYSGDGQWYRCRIQNNRTPGKVSVRYIDYGNSEELEYHQICEIPESLKKKPCLAPKCVLINLIPDEGNISKQALYYLQETILGQHLVITTCSAEDSPVYEVSKCTYSGQNIIEKLVEHKYVHLNSPSLNGLVSSALTPPPQTKTSDPAACSGTEVKNSKTLHPNGVQSAESSKEDDNKDSSQQEVLLLPQTTNASESEVVSETGKLKLDTDLLEKEFKSLKEKCKILEQDLERKKIDLSKYNMFLKLESIAELLNEVNILRNNPPIDDSVITKGISLLQRVNTILMKPQQELQAKIDETFLSYHQSLKAINLKKVKDPEKKNAYRDLLCVYLSNYLSMYSDSTLEHLIEELNKALAALDGLQMSPVDVRLSKEVSSLGELAKAYKLLEKARRMSLDEAQLNTDVAHKEFLNAFTKFQLAYYLFPAASKCNHSNDFIKPPHASMELSFYILNTAVSDLEKALDLEINTVRRQGKPECQVGPSLVDCLIKRVSNTLRMVEEEARVLEKYSSQLNSFSCFSSLHPMVGQVSDIRKEIQSIKARLHQKLVDRKYLKKTDHFDKAAISEIDKAIADLRKELHCAVVEEEYSLKFFAKSFERSFAELELEYPELGLTKYMESGIMQADWEIEHFTCQELPNHLGTCYESHFADKPVVIKEFLLDSEEKWRELEDRILAWNAIESPLLVEILAMFGKKHSHMFAMMRRMCSLSEVDHPESLSDRCQLLISVLNSLEVLHSHNIVHGMIHPSTILVDKETVALDFTFETLHHSPSDLEFRDICFQAPEIAEGIEASKGSDMFAFGCLVLYVLLPDIQFKSSPAGCPLVKNFRVVVERQLPSEDCTAIMSLVSPTVKNRPSAKLLMKCGFLKKMQSGLKEDREVNNISECSTVPMLPIESSDIPENVKPFTHTASATKEKVQQGMRHNEEPCTTLSRVSSLRTPLNCADSSCDVTKAVYTVIPEQVLYSGNPNRTSIANCNYYNRLV